MEISIDISYYPLTEKYLEPIKVFIANLNSYEEIKVQTNGMSTQIFGEYNTVMGIITDEIEHAMELPHSIFILKMANATLDTYTPED